MKTRGLASLLLLLLFSLPSRAQQLEPMDSTDQAPHFAAFRKDLKQAVADRNAGFLRGRLQGARLRFGESTTLQDRYNISDPNSPFWTMLEKTLEMGGCWQADSQMVVYPYAYANFPKRLSPFNHDVVLEKDVPLHNSADHGSFEVGSMSYEVVWVLERGQEWSRVRSEDGVTGWIENGFLYSPTDCRMGLSLVDGRWAIDYIISGD